MKIQLTSASRYNGGIAIKRRWGSSTVTEFYVQIDGDGKTPGERKTYAKQLAVIEEVQES